MKTIGILALITGALVLLFTVTATLLSIWTGDDRWGTTAFLAFIVGLSIMGGGVVAVQP